MRLDLSEKNKINTVYERELKLGNKIQNSHIRKRCFRCPPNIRNEVVPDGVTGPMAGGGDQGDRGGREISASSLQDGTAMTTDKSGDERITLEGLSAPYSFMGVELSLIHI